MNRFRKLGCIALLISLILSTGCNAKEVGREEINSGNQKITVLSTNKLGETESVTASKEFSIQKIDKYVGVKGEDWISDETMLISKENSKLKPISIFDQMTNIRNLYTYDLKARKETSIFNSTDYMWMPIVSPKGKYIFSQWVKSGKYKGVIFDLKGNVKATVDN